MHGHATFKSHILRRDEKGLFGIPFKRLLGCGLGAGGLFTLLRIALPDYAFLMGVASLLVLLIYTAPRGGIPRWRHTALNLQWRLLSAAALTPNTWSGKLGRAFGLPADHIDIDAARLFGEGEEEAPRTALTDWVSFSRALADEDALTFSTTPGLNLHLEAP
ncbi:MAG: hypothetical protein IT323_06315 [Anaerolineae bacterium]|nr:hypothetical protein [Anaerolineae bacterium]